MHVNPSIMKMMVEKTCTQKISSLKIIHQKFCVFASTSRTTSQAWLLLLCLCPLEADAFQNPVTISLVPSHSMVIYGMMRNRMLNCPMSGWHLSVIITWLQRDEGNKIHLQSSNILDGEPDSTGLAGGLGDQEDCTRSYCGYKIYTAHCNGCSQMVCPPNMIELL